MTAFWLSSRNVSPPPLSTVLSADSAHGDSEPQNKVIPSCWQRRGISALKNLVYEAAGLTEPLFAGKQAACGREGDVSALSAAEIPHSVRNDSVFGLIKFFGCRDSSLRSE